MIQIKCRDGTVICEAEGKTMREALEWAVSRRLMLGGANLGGADLRGADLGSANLGSANLGGAYLRDGITVQRAPLQISGLLYPITIWDEHMQIGCMFHSLAEWREMTDDTIRNAGSVAGVEAWKEYGPAILAMAAADGRGTAL